MAIKYLGSKRTLVDVIGRIADATDATDAVDMFTGTTRVAQELKSRGKFVTAVDLATYSEIFAQCYVATDATVIDQEELNETLRELQVLPGKHGYFTETFCVDSRYFQPKNGQRVDAIRDHLEEHYRGSPLYPILLTSLMEAADRVDSTTGIQMAYLKQWAPRAHRDLELRMPKLIPGRGRAIRGDAMQLVNELPSTSFMYLDPPYNQHRYFTNYHIWETLVRWDAPEAYGVARKRLDSRSTETKSIFNAKRQMPVAFRKLLQQARAEVVVVSYNDESWVTADDMLDALHAAGYEDVRMLAFDYKRYVGAQIGVYNPAGEKVGKVSHLRNTEFIFIAGPTDKVQAGAEAAVKLKAAAATSTSP